MGKVVCERFSIRKTKVETLACHWVYGMRSCVCFFSEFVVGDGVPENNNIKPNNGMEKVSE